MDEEDEAFEAIDKAQGWRKRQIEQQLGQPIYFKPRREWVGLTEEDFEYLRRSCGSLKSIAMTVDSLLRKKNHV